MTDSAEVSGWLAAYDAQLRGEPELLGATGVTALGPVWVGVHEGGHGFVSYAPFEAEPAELDALIGAVVEHFEARPAVVDAEWKTRGHDRLPGLDQALSRHGFVAEQPESVMIGPASRLAVPVNLPEGVRLRRVTEPGDVRAMVGLHALVFGGEADRADERVAELTAQLAAGEVALWLAEADGLVVSTGRLEPVPGSQFASIWGGATHPDWRGRGIYRALCAERARHALELGRPLIHSDSTDQSRPILEGHGFAAVTTTTPWLWQRPA